MQIEKSSTRIHIESVKLRTAERAMCQNAADKAGLTRHAWMRQTLLNRARRAVRNGG